MKKKLILSLGGLASIFLLAGVFTSLAGLNHNKQHQLLHESNQAYKVYQQKKRQHSAVYDTKQPIVSAAITMFDKVFSLDWTLPDQAAFDDRAKAMMPYVTNDVVKNSLDFKPDPDKMMGQSGVKITYDHMDFIPISANVNEVKAKVVVFLKSQIDDRPEATTRQIYDVSYSPKQDRVTQLDRLGNFRLQSDSSLLSE